MLDLPSTLNLKTGVTFSTSSAVADIHGTRQEDGIPTNDVLRPGMDPDTKPGVLVDSQQFKYGRDATMLIGTEPRGRLKDAELIKNHSAAFFGRESPGPAANGDKYGPNYEMTKKRMAFAAPFAGKLPGDWQRINSQPDNVGPGMYQRKDIAVGRQFLSHRRNQGANGFQKAPKFEKTRSADTVSLLDSAKSSLGKQVLSKNKSEGSVGFSNCSRDRRSRMALCMTTEDQGPKAFMPKAHHSMPKLPMERDIMRSGWTGIGTG